MPVTIRDVARAAGVSVTTVSHAFNGYEDVGEETKRRVLQVAKDLKYRPSRVARSLVLQQTQSVGLLISDFNANPGSNHFLFDVLAGIHNRLADLGYDVTLLSTTTARQQLISYIDFCTERRLEGVIVMGMRMDDPYMREVADASLVSVGIDLPILSEHCGYVMTDNVAGAKLAVNHLLSKNHQRIGLVNGRLDAVVSIDRLKGYEAALVEAGIGFDPELVVHAEVGVSCTFAQLDDLAGWSGTKEDATQRRWQGRMRLEPRGQIEVSFSVFINPVDCQCGEDTGPTKGFERIAASHEQWLSKMPKVSGCLRYAAWYNQGLRDVRMLQSNLGYGNMIVAGVPWYAVPFGRDSLIAARQLLLAAPEVARGTLWTMAQFQGQEDQPDRDEQPGKVVHEVRDGELSRIGLLPFAPYYGSVDATPLFLMLLADYYRWTGDEVFLRSLLPNVERAFRWMQEYGDRDGDGFLEYWQEAREGIANQGWKDSGDSIMYADGRLVEGPVALCEVQAYAHRAYADWAEIYSALGMTGHAQRMRMQAIRLQDGFNQQFVQADKRIALALDGHKQPCLVTSSNMGQVLVSDLIGKEIADVVAQLMVSPHMLTGFGIRTLSSAEVRYNPLSYHNGSVWPHDTSLIVYGLRRYGYLSEAIAVIDSLLRAQDEFDQHRLPELFAGFSREESLRPVPYPVSCSPQAWAAAIPVFILEQLIGLRPDALRQSIGIDPVLPPSMTQLEITGIRLGVGILSLRMWRSASAVDIDIIENSTGWVVCRSPYVKGGVPR
ncbi:MGH1-like glycoside hydrolase domain-containing protein [Sulfobacillus thermotolerans]|uniref:MGH1-like glycoside hydrolase domain-containing protein n=1 Tax=Sulfobacillus thermotolerans TaxID=338644 RepID=UPI0033689687